MTLPVTAKYLAAHGRNGDSMLVHMTGDEVAGLDALAHAKFGHGLPTNPHTGLPEASLLGGMLPAIIGIGGAMMGIPPMLSAGLMAGGTMLAGGSLMKGLTAGLGAFGGASLAEPFMGAAGAAASSASSAAVPTIAGEMGAMPSAGIGSVMDATPMSGMDMAADAPGALGSYAGDAASAAAVPGGAASPGTPTSGDFARMDRMMPGGSGVTAAGKQGMNGIADLTKPGGFDAYSKAMGGNGKLMQAGLMAAAPMMLQQPSLGKNGAVEDKSLLRPYRYDPATQRYTAKPTMPAKDANAMTFYAGGGQVEGYALGSLIDAANGLGGAGGGAGVMMPSTVAPFADGTAGSAHQYNYDPATQTFAKIVPPPSIMGNDNPFANAGAQQGSMIGMGGDGNGGSAPGAGGAGDTGPGGMGGSDADSAAAADAGMGGPAASSADAAGATGAAPGSDNGPGDAGPGDAGGDAGGDGGDGGYAGSGGIGRPRMLRGPGDGVSDSIPANIVGRGGHRPAALADGEYVIPARIVSELGNGSSDAGARRLDEMVKRVQGMRRQTAGGPRSRVAVDSKAYKAMPA